MKNTLKLALLVNAALAPAALGQDLTVKAPPQSQPIAIVNATIHPVSGPEINGFVIFDKGSIINVGEGRLQIPAGTKVIDAKGKHVYPGFIGAVTQTGIAEIPTVRPYRDSDETGDSTPEATPAVALNADSTIPPVTRANGVLTVGVFPSGGTIPGHAAVVRLEGWTWEEMTVKARAGIVVNWPFMRTINAPWMDRSEDDQRRDSRQRLDAINSLFDACGAYVAARSADPSAPTDIRWEAMKLVLPAGGQNASSTPSLSDHAAPSATPAPGGAAPHIERTSAHREDAPGASAKTAANSEQLPVFINASDADQITSAVAWAIERNLKPVIVGGLGAPLCSELLKKHHVPVIINGTHEMPQRSDSDYDERFALPAKLESLGITWCLASGEETQQERNLPYHAGSAVAYGLSREAALRSITLSPAEILGVSDTLGSLENGKSATLFICDGDPLDIRSNVVQAFVDGREIDLSNKQTKLAEKYRERYRQMGAIKGK
jgi:imidazolonepropionase-like amidohydrolase